MAAMSSVTLDFLVILFLALAVSVSAGNKTASNAGRDTDVDGMVKSVYSTFMVAKNMLSLVTMVWTPFIQFKGFLLSFLGVLINLSRLVLQMRALDRMESMQKKQASDKIEHHMPEMTSHHPHMVKYIVRDYGDSSHHTPHLQEGYQGLQQAWGDDHAQPDPGVQHTWTDDPGSYWGVTGDQTDSWSSPQTQNPWESPPGHHHQPNQIRRHVSSDSYLNAVHRHG